MNEKYMSAQEAVESLQRKQGDTTSIFPLSFPSSSFVIRNWKSHFFRVKMYFKNCSGQVESWYYAR